MLAGASVLFGFSLPYSSDVARHAFLMGFVTHLILGMSVRMIPGFVRRKKIASAKLVDATFWLGNTAAAFRVLPLILPSALFEAMPGAARTAQATFAFSGILGMFAIACLTINLRKTASSPEF
jgi:cbb3-type cytochrome oxidase subunit 1